MTSQVRERSFAVLLPTWIVQHVALSLGSSHCRGLVQRLGKEYATPGGAAGRHQPVVAWHLEPRPMYKVDTPSMVTANNPIHTPLIFITNVTRPVRLRGASDTPQGAVFAEAPRTVTASLDFAVEWESSARCAALLLPCRSPLLTGERESWPKTYTQENVADIKYSLNLCPTKSNDGYNLNSYHKQCYACWLALAEIAYPERVLRCPFSHSDILEGASRCGRALRHSMRGRM